MSVTRIASRYAKSLIDLSVEQKKLERIFEDVTSFNEVVTNRDFYLLLKSPIVKGDKKRQIIASIFEGKYDELTMAFLNILITKGREQYLPEIGREFVKQYKAIKHISTVTVTTATPLSEETVEAIRQKLIDSNSTDDQVEIRTAVDADLLGGFTLEFDDYLYDASVAHKLNQLRDEFDDNLYISQIERR
ncbi:MAG: ATP synthase F1 subunit delta [Bacteroidota bacterium]